MTNEQLEDIIHYLQNNKNSLPVSIISELEFLLKSLEKEKLKKEISQLDNVFIIDEFDEDMLKVLFSNEDLLTNKKVSSDEFNQLVTEFKKSKEHKFLNSIEDDWINHEYENIEKLVRSEHHPKDKGSNYPTNVPPVIPKNDYKDKISNFPSDGSIEVQKHIDDINRQIKSYHQKKKETNLKALQEITPKFEKNVETENLYKWINESEIKKLQEELASFGTPDKVAKVKKYLEKLTTHKSVLDITDYSMFNSLDYDCPNFKEVSKFYKGSFVLNSSKYVFDREYHAPTPILLLGEPGIGKTHFAKKLAKLLGTSFHFLDSNSITASWVLTGSSGQWQNADAGNIFKYIVESNSVSPVVILDEIDKLSQGKNYDPFSVFHQMFEPENATHFKDEFVNLTFDASKIIYILTANNINNIPESLLSRMRVFNIERPTVDEMKVIAKNIYKEIVGHSPLLKSDLPIPVLDKLVALPPRDIKKQLANAVFNQLAECQDFEQELDLDIKTIQKTFGF